MLQMKLLSRVVSDLELEDLWYISPTLNSCTLETKAVWYCPRDGGGGGYSLIWAIRGRAAG